MSQHLFKINRFTPIFNIYKKLYQKSPHKPYIHIYPCQAHLSFLKHHTWSKIELACAECSTALIHQKLFIFSLSAGLLAQLSTQIEFWKQTHFMHLTFGGEKKEENQSNSDSHSYPATHHTWKDTTINKLSVLSCCILRFLVSDSTLGLDNCLSAIVYKWTRAFILISRK